MVVYGYITNFTPKITCFTIYLDQEVTPALVWCLWLRVCPEVAVQLWTKQLPSWLKAQLGEGSLPWSSE